ncbi:MAG TPA: pyruvate synthase [Firmicutes bacterium]|nr:pyruvate synthase [Bacillota bacterium]
MPTTEIRWHARGGQGAKTAAVLLAEAVSATGKFVQGFPEYGPERMGAPMLAFNRISDEPIYVYSSVRSPRVVIVLDPTLVGKSDIAAGLPENGVILINSHRSPQEMRVKLKLSGRKVYTLDASRISQEAMGRDIPNTPMMGALMRVAELVDYQQFLKVTEEQLQHKFRSRPEMVKGNMIAIRRGYEEVRGEDD